MHQGRNDLTPVWRLLPHIKRMRMSCKEVLLHVATICMQHVANDVVVSVAIAVAVFVVAL